MKKGYKKGHKVKGFKNSHQKEESGKTEEYYDEDHDEAGNYMYNGQAGSFGEKGGSAFKGGNQIGNFNAGEAKNQGHYGSKYLADKEKGNLGRYGEGKFGGNFAAYGLNNGGGMHNMMGHHEASKFYKHHPFYNWYY